MKYEPVIFKDRQEAGMRLAEKLLKYKKDKPLVLALPRGGVPIGAIVAEQLNAPLDILVVRKLGVPTHPEFGFGAIAPHDVLVIDENTIRDLGLRQKDIEEVVKREMREMERRMLAYRSGQWSNGYRSETVIIVDDGLATGVTARAALESAKRMYKPKKLIFAAPVCAADTVQLLKPFVDEIVCVSSPYNLMAIGIWYEHFDQVSDEEVLEDLEKVNTNKPSAQTYV